MALGTTGISTTLVANTIGVGSNDVGTLIAKAKTGGITAPSGDIPYAFRIAENENNELWPTSMAQGELIPASLPFWNIYATYSPGEWFKKGGYSSGFQGSMSFRLQRKISTNPRNYDFSLGLFGGHDLTEDAPYFPSRTVNIITNDTNYQTTTVSDLYFYMGKYKFEDKFSTPRIGVEFYKNGIPLTLGSSATNYIATSTEFIITDKIAFRNSYPTGLITLSVNFSNKLHDVYFVEGDYISMVPYIREDTTSSQFDKHYFSTVIDQNPKLNLTIEDHTPATFGTFYLFAEGATIPGGQEAATNTYANITHGYSITIHTTPTTFSSWHTQNKALYMSTDGINYEPIKFYSDATRSGLIITAGAELTLDTGVLSEYAKQYNFRLVEVDDMPL